MRSPDSIATMSTITNNDIKFLVLDIKDKHGLTNKNIGYLVGKCNQSISRYAKGLHIPDEETIKKLEALLEVDDLDDWD